MKKIKQLYLLMAQMSGPGWGIAFVSAVFPILIMSVFALFLAIKYDYILVLSLIIALSTLVICVPLFIIGKTSAKRSEKLSLANASVSDGFVEASDLWSQNEVLIWERSKLESRQLLAQTQEWNELDKVALSLLEFVAKEFGKKALDFSIPEGLQLIGEISRRYRIVVKQYIPGAEMLKVSHLKSGYAAYDQYGELGGSAVKIAIWANYVKNLYVNPAKFAVDIIKDRSSASMSKGLVENIQNAAKRALLDEVASVAIDLYSGRFSFEENEVLASKIAQSDKERYALALEPIRIVIVGQTGAGKSSIINLLKEQFVAEVDVLPSTSSTAVYETTLNDIPIHVVDQQGLDGAPETQKIMLSEMTQADLIIWVLKANQPARQLDKVLKTELDAYYADSKNISRKKAFVIGLVNQVDKLKPVDHWQPPYNLAKPDCAKASLIQKALEYNQSTLKFDLILALSIAPEKPTFGVSEFKQAISQAIENAYNVQRNRQRVEATHKNIGVKQQIKRALHTGKKLYPNILKTAAPQLDELIIKKLRK